MAGLLSMEDKDLKQIATKNLEHLAQAAESAERYDDMCIIMNVVVDQVCNDPKPEERKCSVDQRNMLSVAFKNVVGSKRQSMRALKETLETGSHTDEQMKLVQVYKALVEKEVIKVCNRVLNVVVNGPLAKHEGEWKNKENYVFWLKMCGDYSRYLSEIKNNDDAWVKITGDKEPKKKPSKCAEEYYKKAYEEAEKGLPETHPTRLGLALNYSVCHYEILGKKDDACKLAKKAFDAAIEKLDTLNDKSYKDSTLIMQLLRDNLTLWTSDHKEENFAPPQDEAPAQS